MSIKSRRALLLAAVFGLSAGVLSAQPPGRVEALTRKSEMVFRGTVQRVGAANLKVVKAGEDTAVVKVDEFLKAPGDLGDFAGREVTVKLRAPRSAKAGERAVFFANTWLYGESLGVVEVGRVQDGGPQVRSRVAATAQRMREEEIRRNVDGAALVVTGRVVETRPAAVSRERSEHDPRWWEAVIQVDGVIKGAAGKNIILLYPTSLDVAWYEAPKPQVGWDGVWLLHQDQQVGEMRSRVGGYTALEPWNVMSRDDAGLVKRLVRP